MPEKWENKMNPLIPQLLSSFQDTSKGVETQVQPRRLPELETKLGV